MGNSVGSPSRGGLPSNFLSPHSLKFSANDPRSPTEGIIRTPIVIDKPAGDISLSVCSLPFDTSNFETIDGVETDDDSVHDGINTTAVSDTAIHSVTNQQQDHLLKGPMARIRRSLAAHSSHRNSLLTAHNSPSLFVRLRQKQRIEAEKQKHEARQRMFTDEQLSSVSSDKENCFDVKS